MTSVVGAMFGKGWAELERLGLIKKVAIIRHVVTDPGNPGIGIEPTVERVPGLSEVSAYVAPVSTREVVASQGKIEIGDLLFVFFKQTVFQTDHIAYGGRTYDIITVRFFDEEAGIYMVIGRAA